MRKLLRLILWSLRSEPRRTPLYYAMRRRGGRVVGVGVSDDGFALNNLLLRFERKIEKGDLENGKLVPITQEKVKRRGGKRSVSLHISYEAAEDLHKALTSALKDARKRRFWHEMQTIVFSFASNLAHQ